jgi:hypothetical protein
MLACIAPWRPFLSLSAVALAFFMGVGCGHRRSATTGRVQAAEVPVQPPRFPLRLSDDRRYVVDQTGRPFLIQGDSAWSIIAQLKNDEVETYLEDRRRRGFNTLIVNLLEHKFADHAPANAYGEPPFTKAGDFSTPNEAYFAHADTVLRRAQQKGLAVLLVPAYLGQNGGDEGWYQEIVANGADVLRRYGAYVGRRYAGFDNILWVLGGDYTPPAPAMAMVQALGQGLRANDGGAHLFTAHWSAETSAQDPGTAGLDLNATYTYAPVYEKSLADHLRPGALPHFLIETAYELEHDSTPRSLRAQAYYALLTGAVGQMFGNGASWGFFRPWPGMLGTDGCLSMMNVRALFEPRAWTELVPDDRNEVLTDGIGSKGANDYALLSRTRDGALAIAYVPSLRAVTVDLGRLKRPVRGRWYDPTAGTFADAVGSPFVATAPTSFRPPGSNHAGDPDWILLLETAP